jgi:hypothetical protein
MTISASKVFNYINNNFSQPQAMLEDLIGDALDIYFDIPLGSIQKAEMVNELIDKVRCEIQNHITKCQSMGIVSDFDFGTHPSCLINKKVELFSAKKDFFNWLYNLHPKKFEELCRIILKLEGCNNVKVTPYSGDGGVDFYGTKILAIEYENTPSVFKNVEVSVIGQAKRYAVGNKIDIEQLRCFIGAYNIIRIAELKGSPTQLHNPIDTESFKPLSPSLLIFITSSEADGTTRETAKWLGIKLISGQELVEILYSNNIGFRRYKSGVVFEPSDFATL